MAIFPALGTEQKSGVCPTYRKFHLSRKIKVGVFLGSGKKEFITERTVAAVVFKESFGEENKRDLTMQVVWCVTSKSTDLAKSKTLKSGALISREENHLREFEVLRCQWAQENARWTSSEEKTARAMDNGLLEDDMEMI